MRHRATTGFISSVKPVREKRHVGSAQQNALPPDICKKRQLGYSNIMRQLQHCNGLTNRRPGHA
jgi:hypothetical protein